MITFCIFVTIYFELTTESVIPNLTQIQVKNLDILADSEHNHEKSIHNIDKKVKTVSINETTKKPSNSSFNDTKSHILEIDVKNASLYENAHDKANEVNERSFVIIDTKFRVPHFYHSVLRKSKPETYQNYGSYSNPWASPPGIKGYRQSYMGQTNKEEDLRYIDPYSNLNTAYAHPNEDNYFQESINKVVAEESRNFDGKFKATSTHIEKQLADVMDKENFLEMDAENPKFVQENRDDYLEFVKIPQAVHPETVVLNKINDKQTKTVNVIPKCQTYATPVQKMKVYDEYPDNVLGHTNHDLDFSLPPYPVPENKNDYALKFYFGDGSNNHLPLHNKRIDNKHIHFTYQYHPVEEDHYRQGNKFQSKFGASTKEENLPPVKETSLKSQHSNSESYHAPIKSWSGSFKQSSQYKAGSDFSDGDIPVKSQKAVFKFSDNLANSENSNEAGPESDGQSPKVNYFINDKQYVDSAAVSDMRKKYIQPSSKNDYGKNLEIAKSAEIQHLFASLRDKVKSENNLEDNKESQLAQTVYFINNKQHTGASNAGALTKSHMQPSFRNNYHINVKPESNSGEINRDSEGVKNMYFLLDKYNNESAADDSTRHQVTNQYRAQYQKSHTYQTNEPPRPPPNEIEIYPKINSFYKKPKPYDKNDINENKFNLFPPNDVDDAVIQPTLKINVIDDKSLTNTDHDDLVKLQHKDSVFKELSQKLDELNTMNSEVTAGSNGKSREDSFVRQLTSKQIVFSTPLPLKFGCVYPECMEKAILNSDPNDPTCECEYAIKQNMSKDDEE